MATDPLKSEENPSYSSAAMTPESQIAQVMVEFDETSSISNIMQFPDTRPAKSKLSVQENVDSQPQAKKRNVSRRNTSNNVTNAASNPKISSDPLDVSKKSIKFAEHDENSSLSRDARIIKLLNDEKTEIKTEPPEPAEQLCSVCRYSVNGFVFVCVQCSVRFCGACDARGHHAAHYVLRVPAGRPESELESVLNKVREVLVEINQVQIDWPSHGPDIERESAGETCIGKDLLGEPEYDVIKMEVKVEEEENPAEDQSLYWEALSEVKEIADGTNYLAPKHGVSSTSSVTLTASNPASEDEEDPNIQLDSPNIHWTDYMNWHLIRSYTHISKTESRKSQIYARLKHAFVTAFPHIKVTRSELEEQRRLILREKLINDDELYKIRNEIHVDRHIKPKSVETSPLNLRGVRLELAKVTSGEDIREQEMFMYPWVTEDMKHSQQFSRKKRKGNATKEQGHNKDLKSQSLIKPKKKYKKKEQPNLQEKLQQTRSGRAKRLPSRLLT